MSADDVVVAVSSDTTLAASETNVVLKDEEGIDSEVQTQVFFSGHIWAIWPCLDHSKQRPSCQCFCFSALVVAFRAVVLVSMPFGSHGGSWARGGHALPPWVLLLLLWCQKN